MSHLTMKKYSSNINVVNMFKKFYLHETVHRNKFLFNKTNGRTNFLNLFCQDKLHFSGSSSAHHQEFSTLQSALVYSMQVLTAFKHDQGGTPLEFHPGRV